MGGRVAVLVSGSGTNLQALLDDPAIRPHIVLVVSDRPGVRALERADGAAIEALVIEPTGDRAALSEAVADALAERGIDVIVSAGYMRILGPPVVERWRDRWLNVHPALLPAFPGTHAVADALAAGAKVTGVTVHLVDAGVDTGPVVLQEAIAIRAGDDWDSLEARVHEVEHRLLPRAVRALLEDRLVLHDRVVEIREDP
ncbi:MAG TPA: phosphoribosylglycinamide formyltransferase [Actinomycetota bacterium]|nr:phosphoribosylglycinamide formyltransferase [Actinomycetota bacterium]